MRHENPRRLVILLGSLLAIAAPGLLVAADPPQTTPEGMELIKRTDSRIVYAMPGATLEPYSKILLLDCFVAFRKDWMRDYNRDASFSLRVNDRDMERIKTGLAEEFKKVFEEVLVEAGHEIVDETGPDVLIIRPAIINLEVTAPDIQSASRTHTVVRSAGEMTLFVELYDSMTSAIIARILDAQEGDRNGIAMEANRITNTSEARRIMRDWATELEGHLGEARAATGDGSDQD